MNRIPRIVRRPVDTAPRSAALGRFVALAGLLFLAAAAASFLLAGVVAIERLSAESQRSPSGSRLNVERRLLPPPASSLQPPIAQLAPSASPASSSLQPPASSLPLGLRLPGRVVAVVDGDTLEAEFTFRTRVRLPACWAAELGATAPADKKAALAAKMHLSALAVGRRAVFTVPIDSATRLGDLFTFDRLVADVTIEGATKSLSACQVEAGHAARTKGGPVGR